MGHPGSGGSRRPRMLWLPTELQLDDVDPRRIACVGARGPHQWFFRQERRISTLDLFGSGYVLLAGPSGRAWCCAAARVSRQLRVPLRAFAVGSSTDTADPAGTWCQTF